MIVTLRAIRKITAKSEAQIEGLVQRIADAVESGNREGMDAAVDEIRAVIVASIRELCAFISHGRKPPEIKAFRERMVAKATHQVNLAKEKAMLSLEMNTSLGEDFNGLLKEAFS